MAAVRAMRGEATDLWVSDGGTLARDVDTVLARAEAGEQVGEEMLTLLTTDPALRDELRHRLLGDEDTYREAAGSPSYTPLAGLADPSAEMVYRCRVCDYTYPIFEVGEPVPEGCPDQHGPLVLGV
ncbi:hypothetical protein [Streptomyces sp. NPDC018833]|uniref:hypothetical protein n=1 Tax=Streptomyces sp. NPDC018833 TaxID=3365053 RepID=UPI0037997621